MTALASSTPAEQELTRAIREQRPCDVAERSAVARTVRGDFLAGLLTATDETAPARPRVHLVGAVVEGDLDLQAGELDESLKFENCTFTGRVTLVDARTRSITIEGSRLVSLDASHARVDGRLALVHSELGQLDCDGIHVLGDLEVSEESLVMGRARLSSARIDGDLKFTSSKFRFEQGGVVSLAAEGLRVGGSVFLDQGFEASAGVDLRSARIGGALDCGGARLGESGDPEHVALRAFGSVIGGSVLLDRQFRSMGRITFSEAEIRGGLRCSSASLFYTGGDVGDGAFECNQARIRGSVLLDDHFHSRGAVSFQNARIGNNLQCRESSFEFQGGTGRTESDPDLAANLELRAALHLSAAQVGGAILLEKGFSAKSISLLEASAAILADDRESWPETGQLYLDGFRYGSLFSTDGTAPEDRREWLRRAQRPTRPISTQPYEHLASVFDRMGQETAARKIRVEQRDVVALRLRPWDPKRWWQRFLHHTVRSGLEPWRVLPYVGLVLLTGVVVFWLANHAGLMVRLGNDSPVAFQPIIFSIDSFVPFVSLRQERHWVPDSSESWGLAVMGYLWLHIALGWILSTLVVISFTGVVRSR